jgi:predicted Zn-dependent protease
MVELFQMLAREAGRGGTSVDAFLSSHPSPQDRIDNLATQVKRQKGGTRDSERYRSVKAHLAHVLASRSRDNR